MHLRTLLTPVTAAYAVLILVVIRPDGWMVQVWLGLAGVGLLIAGVFAVLRRQVQEEVTPVSWGRLLPWLVAAATFAIVAVQAAALETRGARNLERDYSLLAVGMVLVVALLLGAYERGRRGTGDG